MITRLVSMPHSLTWRGHMPPTLGGQFHLKGVEEGEQYPVHFLDPERKLGTTITINSSQENPTAILKPCGKATARFVDAAGEPHEGVNLGLIMVITPGPHESDIEAVKRGELTADTDFVANIDRINHWNGPKTDENGEVTYPALIPGATYRIMTYEDGKSRILKQFSVVSNEHLDLGEFTIVFNN